ncbi:MAG: exodeoxyribonuclease I [Gammaproteobacteria bacterium HGW-Gammaproteobacteria-8]|nr:MAG: exodeoxyribonuclease I [Gammaproteobacteria bacterium HGW-Gammaproteobacteria-8]
MNPDSFLWHDYETFGADPRRDRPCQFAALRTDAELTPIGEPVVLYCQPTSDLLPAPEACLITGITPQLARERGLPEYRFAEQIFELMRRPGTCSVGYNSFRFDDEVTRFLFWRNFIDPYAREFRNGNSRFDLIDLLRLAHALRPDGIEWPSRDDGQTSFRLEDLARANGLSVDRAHDALADVENTIALARRLRELQPRMWHWALSLRDKQAVEPLLQSGQMLLHASSRFPAAESCIAAVLPLFRHPIIRSQWLVWNLREDPESFLEHDAETLSDLYWTPREDLPEGLRRLPVKWVRSNRCPMLAPMAVLDAEARQRTGIDPEQAALQARCLQRNDAFLERLGQIFAEPRSGQPADAETALYDGFVSPGDRARAERLRGQAPESLARQVDAAPFDDERLNELLLHFVGRHAPASLSIEAQARWADYRRRRLQDDPELAGLQIADYRTRIAQLRATRPERASILDQLESWGNEIEAMPL